MKYFLAKTEPSEYSISDLEKEKQSSWDGVRNPQAVIFLKQMKPKDKVLIYHSGDGEIVGLAEVVGDGKPDPNDPRSWLVDFKFIRKFKEPYINLKEIKQSGKFPEFRLVRQGRLSTMEVPENFIKYLQEKGLNLA